jgi:hypothetical protein
MAIKNKRNGMLIYSVVLLHGNVCPHTAARTRAILEHFNWELFDHHPYNPYNPYNLTPAVYLPEKLVEITTL